MTKTLTEITSDALLDKTFKDDHGDIYCVENVNLNDGIIVVTYANKSGRTFSLSECRNHVSVHPKEYASQLTSKVQDSGRMEDDPVGYCHLPPLKSPEKR